MLLIIGGLGFIGMHASAEFARHSDRLAVSRFRANRDPKLLKELFDSRVQVVPLDMTDAAAVRDTFKRLGVTSVLNLLAPPPGAWAVGDEYRANMQGLLNLLETSRQLGVGRITLASSIAVYHGLPRGPYRERVRLPMASASSTEAFKKAEEVLASHYADVAGLDVVIVRLAGIYGPLYHSMRNFPSRVCHAAAFGKPLELAQHHADDENDLCYVKDAARGLRLIHTAPRLRYRTYNLGAGAGTRSGAVVRAAGLKATLAPGRRSGAPHDPYMDIARAARDVGYAPAFDITHGVADYIGWLTSHPE
jgi:nucleoside-diphosphate-sugar epimerase